MATTLCRCCGKPVWVFDRHPIHTLCIAKHWTKHSRGVSASRCREFNTRNSSLTAGALNGGRR